MHYYADFKTNCIKLLTLDLHCVRQKCSPKNLVFWQYMIYGAFVEITENECVKERYFLVKSDNLISTARYYLVISTNVEVAYNNNRLLIGTQISDLE